MTKMFKIIALFVVAYVGTYLMFRVTNTEIWEVDGRSYVIFGSRFTYYLFRPLSYIDGAATEMRFHIGPHQSK